MAKIIDEGNLVKDLSVVMKWGGGHASFFRNCLSSWYYEFILFSGCWAKFWL